MMQHAYLCGLNANATCIYSLLEAGSGDLNGAYAVLQLLFQTHRLQQHALTPPWRHAAANLNINTRRLQLHVLHGLIHKLYHCLRA